MLGKYNTDLQEGEDFFVKENHWIPKKLKVEYFAFGDTLYCRGKKGSLPKHELLHISQFRKYGVVYVVAHYFFHFVRNYLKSGNGSRSFLEIPFEMEATAFETKGEQDFG